jgi:hypothetical protein
MLSFYFFLRGANVRFCDGKEEFRELWFADNSLAEGL